jgi:hypothetical protein
MSSVHNHNTGLTINIYNPPPAPETSQARMRGLSQEQDFENCGTDNDGDGSSAIDNLPLPGWMKAALKSMFGETGDGLPSSSDAAKSLRDFQKDHDIGLLGSEQVKHMAETGYCTMPNGKQELVPEEVQLAAQKMMANNGELFKKLETAIRPNHDGLLSAADYDAALKDGSIGKPGTADLPTEQVLDSDAFFKAMMGGAISGNRPGEYNAAKSIQGFQKEHDIKHLTSDQVAQMADTGYCTKRGGDTFQVPPDIQSAAKKMMDNNGELFKKLETSIRAEHDGLLSQPDVDQAVKNGSIGREGPTQHIMGGAPADTNRSFLDDFDGNDSDMLEQFLKLFVNDLVNKADPFSNFDNATQRLNLPTDNAGNGMPSSSDAARTIHDFQAQKGIELLSSAQAQQIAETGYCTLPDGKTIQVPPDVQAACMKAMENNADLFKKLESAVTGDFDGLLSKADYHEAMRDGTIGKPGAMANGGTTGANGSTGPGPAAPNSNGPVDKSEFGAIDTMGTFMKDNMGKEMLNRDQIQQMADTGKLTKQNGVTMDVPPDVQESAKRMMADNGAMFDKIEVAHNGKKDGIISQADLKPAWKDSVKETTTTIIDFQKSELKGDFLTRANMKEMADTGNLTKNDGSVVQVPAKVREAAKNYMDNDAKLFKEVESWQNNKHDDKLSVKDGETRRHRLDHGKNSLAAAFAPIPLAGRAAAAAA